MAKARRQNQHLESILQRIHEARSFDFRNYKRPTLQRRIERRMQARRCKTMADKRQGEEIRVWCAGCATGEETFSAAILFAEAMGPSFATQEVKVFGTDVDEKAIAFARHGVYSREQVQGVSKERLKEYFVEDAHGFTLKKEIRHAVVFGVNNLVSDAPISRLDLLLCRNVFIYLDAALQKRVLTRFHYALRPRGILV